MFSRGTGGKSLRYVLVDHLRVLSDCNMFFHSYVTVILLGTVGDGDKGGIGIKVTISNTHRHTRQTADVARLNHP